MSASFNFHVTYFHEVQLKFEWSIKLIKLSWLELYVIFQVYKLIFFNVTMVEFITHWTDLLFISLPLGAVCVKISTSINGAHSADRYVLGAFECGALVRSTMCEPGM